ncbi:prepilin-type N-terminal cleavage/methylation domain-containing protein [Deinococcus sp.]|uniref:PulJ/GspJ family protein n=1 Tax=Deinococcus sp. TaxID=47478 RepID=UPI0028698A62|nr:prepilin-type N-terminal cleavage/methylation domain-containing protein [Deinococcus sp.]
MNRAQGFTLIELLVAMTLFAAVTIAALQLQGSSTQLSGVQISQSQRLQTLSDTSGYLADQIRAGARVYTGLTLPDGLGSSSVCTPTGAQPCLAVLVPVTQPLTCSADPSTIIAWRLHEFRYVPRASLPATYKGNTVQDTDASGLLEVRISDPAIPAPAPGVCGTEHSTIPSSISAYQTSSTYVVAPLADDLTVTAGTAPFAFDTSTNIVTLRLQSASRTQGKLSLTPVTPYELLVKTRNK